MKFLDALLPHFGFHTDVFFAGIFCTQNLFAGSEQVGHLHFVRSGTLVMQHEGQADLKVRGPALVLYPRPFRHHLIVTSASAELICANISFKDLARNPLAKVLPPYLVIQSDEDLDFLPILSLLIEESRSEEDGRHDVMNRLCDILLIKLFRHLQRSGQLQSGMLAGLGDTRIAEVMGELHRAPHLPWQVSDMARIAAMSRSSFAKCFHQTVGVPPAEYLTDVRISLALTLLRGNASIKNIASATGYASQPAFSKAFTQKIGMSSSQWLQSQSK